MNLMRTVSAVALASFTAMAAASMPATAQQQQKPNILVIWGDDIGVFNLSAYNMGMMGYRTPNIDGIAQQGAVFTDWYGQQSCTAGRAAFITGQSPIRTGLTKVGLPGALEGLHKEDPTLAELLKPQGMAPCRRDRSRPRGRRPVRVDGDQYADIGEIVYVGARGPGHLTGYG